MAKHNKDVKHPQFGHLPLSTSGPVECALTGTALLRSPYLNKGSAFTKVGRTDATLPAQSEGFGVVAPASSLLPSSHCIEGLLKRLRLVDSM